MIISLRGTSGSGKSHMVRTVASQYERHRSAFIPGRQKPYYVVHGRNRSGRCLVIPGHYEIANGGMDTLRTLDEAYAIARWADACSHDVLMEGKNMGDGTRHVEMLMIANKTSKRQTDIFVVHLDIPVEDAIASVRARGHAISEASIRRTDAKVRRDMTKFTCPTFSGNRAQCLEKVLELLGMENAK